MAFYLWTHKDGFKVSAGSLATYLGMSKGTAANALNELIGHGWLTRVELTTETKNGVERVYGYRYYANRSGRIKNPSGTEAGRSSGTEAGRLSKTNNKTKDGPEDGRSWGGLGRNADPDAASRVGSVPGREAELDEDGFCIHCYQIPLAEGHLPECPWYASERSERQ